MPAHAVPPPARRALIALGSALVALAAGEAWLRRFRPVAFRRPIDPDAVLSRRDLMHRASEVPGLLYELVPGYDLGHEGQPVTISSLGLRDAELLPAEAGARRIAVVGDSVTFGTGVADGETFCDELERALDAAARERGQRVEVLNFGVSGYSIDDYVRTIDAKVVPLAPELVLVAYSLNDPDVEPVQHLQHLFAPVRWWERWELLRLVAWKRRIWEIELRGGDVFRWVHARDGPAWRHVPRAFAELRALERRGLETVVFVVPVCFGFQRPDAPLHELPRGATRWTSWDEYPYAAIHAQVVEAARAAGLEAWDLLEDVRAGGLDPGSSMADFVHPNAAGHAAIGRALAQRIRSRPGFDLGAGTSSGPAR